MTTKQFIYLLTEDDNESRAYTSFHSIKEYIGQTIKLLKQEEDGEHINTPNIERAEEELNIEGYTELAAGYFCNWITWEITKVELEGGKDD